MDSQSKDDPPPPYLNSTEQPSAPLLTAEQQFQVVQPPIVTQPATIKTVYKPKTQFGRDPQHLTCPICQTNVVTSTKRRKGKNGGISPVICLDSSAPNQSKDGLLVCLCLTLFCLGCCLLLASEDCKDIEHRCPNCTNIIGMHRFNN